MTTDNLFVWLLFTMLIFSTINYDRLQVLERQTLEARTLVVEILEAHTVRLVKWEPPKPKIVILKEEG